MAAVPGRRRFASALTAALATALLVGACTDDDPNELATTSAPATITSGPVAATELVAGDCLSGLVIGAAERARIDSARVVGCQSTHEVEVFATFALTDADFEVAAGAYPGQQRIVDAADAGCDDRLKELGEIVETLGLIAIWPTEESWRVGDREVACAVYPLDGAAFDGDGLVDE